jgi:hypothetical protein
MAKDNQASTRDRTDTNPAHQTGEDKGKIKKPQQTDATMAEKDLARGSEKETHARK